MDVLRQDDLNTWVSGMWWNIPSHPISILWILAKNYHLLGWMWDDPHLIDIIRHLFASQMILSNFQNFGYSSIPKVPEWIAYFSLWVTININICTFNHPSQLV
jgi:hypothetical protein